MKPRDIAATTHAIASSGVPLPQDKPVPHPGVLLRNADNTGHGQCPSDKVCSIPSNETMTSPTAGLTPPTGVAQVVTTEKLTKTSSTKTESKKPPNGSSKGPTIREISSETNIWIPSTADAQGARSTPAKSESTSKRSSLPPDATREPPLDVYELRRRQERAQMTEIAMRQLRFAIKKLSYRCTLCRK
ncbi:unnamed protein product [Nippostrongylus brasiliensis]|uniref:Uncharacterized protein n=1 Tax=Nippostrongylus brasiliensis TaxID=27835 RepID=A0A0N4Y2M6_NIPBR|nr:unnamed protein product [Nippostrongylus brasiliensis]